jgi:hypothetical protein
MALLRYLTPADHGTFSIFRALGALKKNLVLTVQNQMERPIMVSSKEMLSQR